MRRLVLAVSTLVAVLAGAPAALSASNDLFFSEYVEGSSNNKALEIFNDTGAPIDLGANAYNVQMFFNGATTPGTTVNLSGTVADDDVFVLAQALATFAAQADQRSSASWFNGDDAVVLRKGTTVIDVIGQIGLDPGTEWGTGLTSTADNTLRRTAAVTDGDPNGADAFDPAAQWDGFALDTFGGLGSHSATPPADDAPTVASTTPAAGRNDVARDANVTVTFSEPVSVAGSWFTISCTASGAHAASVSGGPTSFTLDPATDFVEGDACTVTVAAGGVADQDSNDPPDAMSADASWSFTVSDPCAQPFTSVPSIQGSGPAAATTGVVTTQGVVVGDFEGSGGIQGFYLQDAAGDGDAATSDGIFVYTGFGADTVDPGELVRVTGYARERFEQTTLNGSNSNTSAVGAASIVACGSGTVVPTDVVLPFAAAAAPEPYEGMLVRFAQSLVISEYFNYDRFGELVLALPLAGETRPFTGTSIDEPGAAALARSAANALRRITLDDGSSPQNPFTLRHPNGSPFSLANRFRGGDTVQGTVGVLGFDFGVYRIQPTAPAAYAATNPRPAAPEPVGGSLRVAAMNTLNFFLTLDQPTGNPLDNTCGPARNVECRGADAGQSAEFTRQREKLLAAIVGLNADVLGLNELENTTGVDPLGDPDGIVAGLNERLGPGTYGYVDTGAIGTDAIRVGLIYKPAKVTPAGDFELLTSAVDPRFLDTKSRPALAQTFEVNATSATFTVAVNHLKSKGSACNDVGDPNVGDGQGNCNRTRTLAAQALVDWLATDPTASDDPDFLILGDLNSYAKEDPIDAVRAGADDTPGTPDDYTNLIAAEQGPYAYSYVFDGQAGYLDHALATAGLVDQVTGATDWHINADEPDVLDYDTSFKPDPVDALYEANAFRSSDHDPVLAGLALCEETPPTLSLAASPSTLRPPNHKYVTVNVAISAADNSGTAPTVAFVSATSNEPDNAPGDADGNTTGDIVRVDLDTFRLRAERSETGTGRVYTLTYRATDACGNRTTKSVTVSVPRRP